MTGKASFFGVEYVRTGFRYDMTRGGKTGMPWQRRHVEVAFSARHAGNVRAGGAGRYGAAITCMPGAPAA